MEGVEFQSMGVVHEDDRRSLIEVVNGEFVSKQIKIIKVKEKDSILGNHYHPFGQLFYLLSGKARYTMVNVDTKEREIFDMEEGDRIIIAKKIAHRGIFLTENCVTIEGNEEPYTGPECDLKYEIN
jgi:quercetin dioxygenase-like cupin family protein